MSYFEIHFSKETKMKYEGRSLDGCNACVCYAHEIRSKDWRSFDLVLAVFHCSTSPDYYYSIQLNWKWKLRQKTCFSFIHFYWITWVPISLWIYSFWSELWRILTKNFSREKKKWIWRRRKVGFDHLSFLWFRIKNGSVLADRSIQWLVEGDPVIDCES